jgi:phosphatidate cytidylyltransferase
MLKQRVITALIAAPLVICALFLLPLTAFAAVFLVLAGFGVLEWANLAGIRSVVAKVLYVVGYALVGFALLNAASLWSAVFEGVAVFWVLAAIVVLTFPASGQVLVGPVLAPAGYVALVGAWLALIALQVAGGPWLILWVLIVVWAADIGAYFAGRRFGRHKLAVLVSPGKTWEGAIGGTLLSVLLGSWLGAVVPALQAVRPDAWHWVVGSLLVAVVSVFGDLFESALKRARGVKDSGDLFPGHGGMLDRVDSLIAALPCVALAVTGQL